MVRASELHAQRAALPAGTPASRPALLRFFVAFAAVSAAWIVRTALTPMIGETAEPFITFFPAVAWAAWYGGLAPAIITVVVGALLAEWSFMAPLHTATIDDPVAFVVFPIAAAFIVIAIELTHRARAALATTRDIL